MAYEYTQITISQQVTGQISVSIGLWAQDPNKRSPRPIRRPWEHIYYLQNPVTQEQVFQTIRGALMGLTDPL